MNVLTDIVVGVSASVLGGVMICVAPNITVDALAEVNVDVRAGVITGDIRMLIPLEKLLYLF